MRILMLMGLQCEPYYWSNWKPLEYILQHYRDDLTFTYWQDSHIRAFEIARMRKFVDWLVEKYDDGTDTMLFGHSMGGVFACAVAARFRRSRVRGIVTVCSPHAFPAPMFPRLLGATVPATVPLITFAGNRDNVVSWGAHHPQSRGRYVLDCDHWHDLAYNGEQLSEIAAITAQHFF